MIYKKATVTNIELYVYLHSIYVVFHFFFNKIITEPNWKIFIAETENPKPTILAKLKSQITYHRHQTTENSATVTHAAAD